MHLHPVCFPSHLHVSHPLPWANHFLPTSLSHLHSVPHPPLPLLTCISALSHVPPCIYPFPPPSHLHDPLGLSRCTYPLPTSPSSASHIAHQGPSLPLSSSPLSPSPLSSSPLSPSPLSPSPLSPSPPPLPPSPLPPSPLPPSPLPPSPLRPPHSLSPAFQCSTTRIAR
ncbi:unnamed protein product [Closterium sp. Naga37s-1]|nr:unnamed protein product [Closterium sp. Naga37s-1]